MKALITGITGAVGSYLAEYLLEQGYTVYGLVRRTAHDNLGRIRHILNRVTLIPGDITSYGSVFNAFQQAQPDETYLLAAQSFVMESFKDPFSTLQANVDGIHNCLHVIKNYHPKTRVYQASSSEMFGKVVESPQSENTIFVPQSIYAISKVAGYQMIKHYRDAYNIHASNGICFNSESPRRGQEFVTQKICRYAVAIAKGKEKELPLGNCLACRDWHHSRDTVRCMHNMLQMDKPDDYVISSGTTHSVHDFAKLAFAEVGLDCDRFITISEEFKRPSDVELLLGDSSKAKRVLGWEPTISFHELVKEMVHHQLATQS